MTKYSDQKNLLILLSLLKQYNIRRIIVSPGATVTNFAGSVQEDDFFELYSSVDERSACYMACGMAAEAKEPVAIVCTGATASRNYLPGLTEAYYRKLPVLAITSAMFHGNIGHNIPQMIDRTRQLNDIARKSVQIHEVRDKNDEWLVTVDINKALHALTENGGGPVHINLEISNAPHFSIAELPVARKINKYHLNSTNLPELKGKKVAVFVGAHDRWDNNLTTTVDHFVEKYNSVVLCDAISNYCGKYKIQGNLSLDQENYHTPLDDFDVLIHLGNVSGSYMKITAKETWRVNPDGELVDTFKNLKHVFAMEELEFFNHYNSLVEDGDINTSVYQAWSSEYQNILGKIDDLNLPLSNIWLQGAIGSTLPENSIVHYGILSSLRSANFFDKGQTVLGYSNTGGFGIDGNLSSLLGAALVHPEKLYYGIVGDLSFFYDMNTLGNRMMPNNIRLILINNACGAEFHLHINPAYQRLGHEGVSRYIAADAHFGNKSKTLVKHYAEDLGFEYIPVYSKKDFIKCQAELINPAPRKKPLLIEVFTDQDDENKALLAVRTIEKDLKGSVKNNLKKFAAKTLNEDTKKKIRRFLP